MSVADLIRTNRIEHGISQAELAARSGTSQGTLSRYESGEAVPTISTLERLLAACGASLELSAHRSSRVFDVRSTRLSKVRDARAAILEAARKRGIRNVAVFGSVARGTDGADSDIDLLVDFNAFKLGILPVFDFAEEVSSTLNERVDVAVRQLLTPAVAATALIEEVAL